MPAYGISRGQDIFYLVHRRKKNAVSQRSDCRNGADMYEQLKNKTLFNLDETIAKDIFRDVTFPWEVLPLIKDFILELGASLTEGEYEHSPDSCHKWFLHYWQKHRSKAGGIYPRKRYCGGELRGWKFNRA